MTPDRWQRVKKLFAAAHPLPIDERAGYLDQHCGGDVSLRSEVESLLAQHDASSGFLENVTGDRPADLSEQDETRSPLAGTLVPGSQIGSYRVIDVLGEGGMGVVFRAEQDKPRRMVALKVIKPGFASRRLLRRFEHEAEALARLHHPGIAPIFEAGTADAGQGPQPFFAMELVEGQTIVEYAEARRLGTRQRLELIACVCDAVQHAHQRGVIHRDLKPANILVEESGRPKILDFGVARVTDVDVRTATTQTDVGQLVGTIPYMSPEQCAGDPEELDTRSDVYALGVVMYELLTGRLPYDVSGKHIYVAVRVIREDGPTPLSSASKLFRGDLNTIAAKALEKGPTRRYQSASDLAADIRRYLNDEPIVARPPSTLYQLRKFARRNQTLVAGVILAFTALAVGSVAATWQAVRATQARQESDAVTNFLARMLAEVDPEQGGRDVRVKDILDRAARSIGEDFADRPRVEARLRHTIGRAYTHLDDNVSAEPHLRRALDLRTRILGGAHRDTAETMFWLASALDYQSRWPEAEGFYAEALAVQRRTLGLHNEATARTMISFGNILTDQRKLAEAEPILLEAYDTARRVWGDGHRHTLSSINALGRLRREQRRLAEAEQLFRKALEERSRRFGANHLHTLSSAGNLADILYLRGRLESAEQLLRDALARSRTVLGDHVQMTIGFLAQLAEVLTAKGEGGEAERLAREALQKCETICPNEHLCTRHLPCVLGELLLRRGRLGEAEEYLTGARESCASALGGEHPDTLVVLDGVARVQMAQGELAKAERLLERVVETTQRTLPQGHWRTFIYRVHHGACLAGLQRYAEAENQLLAGCRGLTDKFGTRDWRTREALGALADLYRAWGREEKAWEYRRMLSDPNAGTDAPAP